MEDKRPIIDYKILTGRSDSLVVIFRHFVYKSEWVMYFEHEANMICNYEGIGETPEEAIRRFIDYRIDGKEQPEHERRSITRDLKAQDD